MDIQDTTDSGGDEAYRDPPMLSGKHLIIARSVWRDISKRDAQFGVAGIYTEINLPREGQFPLYFERLFVYAQVWGDDFEHHFRIRLVHIEADGDDEWEEDLGHDGAVREFKIPTERPVDVSSLVFVQEFFFPIGPVVFPRPGLYEFQLWADGIYEPIIGERIKVTE